MPVCVLFVSCWSGIVFNPSAGAITDHSQSAKDTDTYLKIQLYVEDPAIESRYTVYPVGRVNPKRERTTEILISAAGGIRTYNLLFDNPARYH